MRTLIADDHALFRDGIISLLEAADFEIVGQASDGKEAVRLALEMHPELVLMDVHMPVLGGVSALKAIKASAPDIKVVMLTVSEDDAVLMEAVKSGADGYLYKHLHAEEFLDSLRGLRRGEAAIARKAATSLMKTLTQDTASPAGAKSHLTGRELEVLRLVARGLSNKAIASQLTLSENTIKYHLKNVLQKLNVQNRTEAVSYAIGQGWISAE